MLFSLPPPAYAFLLILSIGAADAQDFVARPEGALQKDETQFKVAVFFAIVPIVLAFIFAIFILYRKRREAYFSQKQAELGLSIVEVELKALRAQINPHFIFNCLNSIHHYVQRNESKTAGDYLIKFSQLIRLILENSLHKTIILRDDLDALELYIQLEQLRLDQRFSYHIDVDNRVDPRKVEVPPLLIQPFVENAIWHGLAKVKENGILDIKITMQGEQLLCVIENSGVGLKMEEAGLTFVEKRESLGLSLVQERLDILNRSVGGRSRFISSDIVSGQAVIGRQVKLHISIVKE